MSLTFVGGAVTIGAACVCSLVEVATVLCNWLSVKRRGLPDYVHGTASRSVNYIVLEIVLPQPHSCGVAPGRAPSRQMKGQIQH